MNEMSYLPKGWHAATLDELTEINPKLPYKDIDDDLLVSFLPMKLVEAESNKIHLTEIRKYSEVKKGFTPMIDEDVIFAKITPCMENGKIAVVHSLKNKIGLGSTEFHVFRCNKSILNKFLFFFLIQSKFRREAQSNMTGAVGQRRVPKKYIEKIIIPLPPFQEQHRIVAKIEELFSSLDKGIESLKTAQAQLKIYRQAVLKWAFEDNWELKKFGVVAEIKRGKSKHRPRDAKELFGGSYPFIQTGDVKSANGGIITKYSQTYSDIGLAQSKLWPKGTLCLTIAANIADTAFLGFDACFPDSVVGIKTDEKILLKKFVNYYIQKLKQEIDAKASATAQKNINVQFLENIPIPLPAINEQEKIVAEIEKRFSVCDKLEESIAQSLAQAEALRQSILKKAFEGKLVPQDPNNEPAGVLLERIREERSKQAGEARSNIKNRKGKIRTVA